MHAVSPPRYTAGVASRELLRDALALWRDTRAEAVADVVDRITDDLSRGWEPPAPKLARTFQAAWLAAAADDIHRGWAARHIMEKLPDRVGAVRERLNALLAAGPDPRVRLPVEQLGKFEELVARIVAVAPGREPTAAELARFAPVEPTVDERELESDVYANPDDDVPRAVLADLLQSRGDPRGELISLQLAGAGDARVEELVRDHGRMWLGPLHEIAAGAEMQRGFLTRLELAAGSAESWERAIDHPLLGTVEDLIPGECSGPRYAELISCSTMRALRRIEVFDLAVVGGMERMTGELVHVACPPIYVANRNAWDEVLPACARFAGLRSVACLLSSVPEVMRALGERLTSLTVVGEVGAALALWRNLRRPIDLVIAPHARLPKGHEGSISARREDGRVIVRVEGAWAMAICGDLWSLLPADRLEIVEPLAMPERLQRLAGAVEIVRLPARRRSGVIPGMIRPSL